MAMWNDYEKLARRLDRIANAFERIADALEADRKTEPQIEGVWNAGFKTGYDKGYKDAQKVKDSQDLVKDLVKAFCEDGTWLERQGVYTLTLAEAKQRAVDIIESVTQTETQNSNLTFEKRTMRDCYNCKKYETEGECIECRFEPKDEPQTDCYVSDLCKHYGDKQICGRCRSRNLFCEAEPQPRCPKCGKRGYIRSLESMGVKLKVFDEYKWKCTNCNKYFKEEPKDEPQTDCPKTCPSRDICTKDATDCAWK